MIFKANSFSNATGKMSSSWALSESRHIPWSLVWSDDCGWAGHWSSYHLWSNLWSIFFNYNRSKCWSKNI